MRKISLYIEKDFCPAHDIKPSGTILQILFKMEVSSMRMKQRKGGYSANTAKNYIDLSAPTRCLSVELDEQVKFVDGKPTDEIVAYKAWFTQEGVEPFQVKFENRIELPEYLSLIEFDGLKAIEINYKVYFKADDIHEVN